MANKKKNSSAIILQALYTPLTSHLICIAFTMGSHKLDELPEPPPRGRWCSIGESPLDRQEDSISRSLSLRCRYLRAKQVCFRNCRKPSSQWQRPSMQWLLATRMTHWSDRMHSLSSSWAEVVGAWKRREKIKRVMMLSIKTVYAR